MMHGRSTRRTYDNNIITQNQGCVYRRNAGMLGSLWYHYFYSPTARARQGNRFRVIWVLLLSKIFV